MGNVCKSLTNRDLVLLWMAGTAQVMIVIAIGLESKAFDADVEWNSILTGDRSFSEAIRGEYFYNKTIDMDDKLWSEEKKGLYRNGSLELTYIGFLILVFVIICVHHLLLFFFPSLRDKDKVNHKMGVVILYMVLGVIMLGTFGMLSSSLTHMKDNIISVHSHLFKRSLEIDQNYNDTELERMNEILFLKDMLGICIRNSLYLQVNPTATFVRGFLESVVLINSEDYGMDRIKGLGFCPLEEFKVASLVFTGLGSLMCWMTSITMGCFMRYPPRGEENVDNNDANPSSESETSTPPAEPVSPPAEKSSKHGSSQEFERPKDR